VELAAANLVDPSKKTYNDPSGATTGREPWSYNTFPEMDAGLVKVRPPSLEDANKIGDCTYAPVLGLKRKRVQVT